MKYIITILTLFLLVGCKEKIITEIPEEMIVNATNNVEVYSNIKLYDLIEVPNGEILTENRTINTEHIGEEEIEVLIKYEKKKYRYILLVKTEDTTKPEIFGGSVRTVTINHTGNLCNLIMYGDNYDGMPDCVIEGEPDVNKLGTYDIKYVVTDKSGNSDNHNLTLHVVKPSSSSGGGSTAKIQFSDILDRHKNDRTEIGIDVSKWQGNIDFKKVASAGATFVIMRIGVQRSVKGELEIDPYYIQNMKRAKEAGLKVGVYLYSIATSIEESIEHAEWVIKTLDGEELDLPIVFDWESWSIWNSLDLSFHNVNEMVDKFIETVHAAGYEGMLYSSKNYLINIWTNKNNYPVWLAHYTSETDYSGDYVIWQMTDKGRIAGINGNVDINIMYK